MGLGSSLVGKGMKGDRPGCKSQLHLCRAQGEFLNSPILIFLLWKVNAYLESFYQVLIVGTQSYMNLMFLHILEALIAFPIFSRLIVQQIDMEDSNSLWDRRQICFLMRVRRQYLPPRLNVHCKNSDFLNSKFLFLMQSATYTGVRWSSSYHPKNIET